MRRREDVVGEVALCAGIVAIAFAIFPIAGELVAGPASLVAIVCGYVGWTRCERGLATNARQALTGLGLGVGAQLLTLLVVAAMASPSD